MSIMLITAWLVIGEVTCTRLSSERRAFHLERLSESQRASLQEAVTEFHSQLPGSPAETHLEERGCLADGLAVATAKFRLGYGGDPLPGFERYQGMLAIPYLRWHPRHGWSCVSLRFRRLGESGPKYQTMPGDRPRLFNAQALNAPVREVGITEGELDAVAATIGGLPTVGVPGATSWKPHFEELFRGYRTVYVFTDGDEPGEKFGYQLAAAMSNVKVIPSKPGEDLNSILMSDGPGAVAERFK